MNIYIILFLSIFLHPTEYSTGAGQWSLVGALENIQLSSLNNTNCSIYKFDKNTMKYINYKTNSVNPDFNKISKKEGFFINGYPKDEKCIIREFGCKGDGREFSLEIKATFCSFSEFDEGRYWERNKGLYKMPANKKTSQVSKFNNSYKYYCGIIPEKTILNYGGVSSCFEANVWWDYKN